MADSQNDLELPDLGQPEASASAQSGAPNPAAAARAAAGVRTLEEILWAAATAYGDPGNTALIDREEFAAQIFASWEGEVPCEAFISRFFDGPRSAEGGRPQSMAEAVARAARSRLNAYEFDLNKLEYVVIEDKDDFIIVSSAGEFALPDSSVVRASILDAVIADDQGSPIGGRDASVDRSDQGQPRAFLVKRNGDIVAVDVMKLAAAIKTSQPVLRTADTPLADRPSARLQPFNVRRRSLTESREVELLKRDRRVNQWDAALPSNRRVGSMELAAGGAAGALAAPPAGADQTILLLMPDGTLARPVIGAASRWQEMVNEWVGRAAIVSLGATSAPQAVLPGQTFIVQSDRVVSIFTNGGKSASGSGSTSSSEGSGSSSAMSAFASYASSQGLAFGSSALGDGFPGSLGRSTEAQAQAITSVRLLQANVRELSEDALAEAVARGAKLLGGFSTPMSAQGLVGNAFWIQPEVFFAPTAREQADAALDLAQSGSMSRIGEGTTRQLVAQGYNVQPGAVSLPGTPLQLGQVTGDPWADWALATGGQITESDLAMPALMARMDRDASPMSISAAEAFGLPPGQSLEEARHNIKGGRVIAFRAPDGTLVVQAAKAVHLAEAGRVVQDGSGDSGPGSAPSRPSIGYRSGAVPQSALNTLATALERTAAAGGYKLPQVRILSAPDALERGDAMSAKLDGGSPYRQSVRLAGTTDVGDGGQVARMVLSMPFPSSGELVVGSDLSEALQSLLSAPAVPMSRGGANASGSYGDPGAQGLIGDDMVSAGGGVRQGSGVWLAGGALGGAALGGLAGALALRGGSGGGPVMGPDGQFIVRGGGSGSGSYGSGPGGELVIDLGGQHQQARSNAQDALTTFEMPDVAQSLASQSSFSRLPVLLRRALAESGDWAPGNGTPLPASVRQLVLSSPFDLPELVTGDAGAAAAAAPPRRQVNPGQEEIVIPMPLWAQMGRGQMSETQDILASPRMPKGFQPPLGHYRLVAPSTIDMTGGASEGSPGVSRLSGPTHMMIDVSPRGGVSARSNGGNHQLARMSSDAADAVLSQRRMKIGAPLSAAALAAVMSKRRPSGPAPRRADDQIAELQSQASAGRSRSGSSYGPVDSGGFDGGAASGSTGLGGGTSGFSGSGSGGFGGSGVGKIPNIPNIDLPDAASVLSSGGGTAAGGGRTMAGALQSAMRMSDAVDGRLLPASAGPGSVPSFRSGFPGGSGVLASPSRASSGMAGSGFSSGGSSSGGFGSLGGGASGGAGGDTYILGGGQGGGGGSVRVSAAAGNAPGTSNIISSAQASSSSAVSTRWGEPGMAPGGKASSISLYQLGGGAAASAGGMGSWDFSGIGRGSSGMTGGSSDMGSLRREALPSLPTALRFRYAGAPLWWSSGGSGSASGGGADDAGDDDDSSEGESRFGRPLRSALRAANSAATLWRSILVHPSGGGHGAQQRGGSGSGSDAGGMDRSWDENASSMSSLDGKLAILALGTGGGAAAGAASGKGAESVYIAMDNAGRAGTVTGNQAGNQAGRQTGSSKLDSLSMSIVAAVPPAPPPLESMGGGSGFGGTSAQAHYEPRAKKHGAGHGHEGGGKSADEGTSHSKIEGSVDAIAQRIYHRIRRRIASDRERFGG